MELRWALRARRDLFEIADHYGGIHPGLADQMLREVETAPLMLLEHPYAGPPLGDTGLRKWTVRKTPLVLLYRVGRSAIEVMRIVHYATNWQAEP